MVNMKVSVNIKTIINFNFKVIGKKEKKMGKEF